MWNTHSWVDPLDTFCRCSHRLHISGFEVLCLFLLCQERLCGINLEFKFICTALHQYCKLPRVDESGNDVMGIKFGRMKFGLKLRTAGIYCFSQQDQFLKSTMCFNRCQHCICSWFLWRKRGSRDLNESLVKTWAWLYLLNFKQHTCAYLMLTNSQFMTAHSSPLPDTYWTAWDSAWQEAQLKLYWNETILEWHIHGPIWRGSWSLIINLLLIKAFIQ